MMPVMMFAVSASPKTNVPTRIAVIGSKTPNTEALVAPMFLEAIAKVAPRRIVYVSCSPASLARDLHYLEEHGYKTMMVQPVDMFPMTSHIENVVLLERV